MVEQGGKDRDEESEESEESAAAVRAQEQENSQYTRNGCFPRQAKSAANSNNAGADYYDVYAIDFFM